MNAEAPKNVSRWTSPQAEQRFRELEDALAAELMSERPASIVVPTHLGPTHVYRWPNAAERADPGEVVVFLHGATGTALSWATYAAGRRGHEVYAVDTIGDVGRSRQEAPVESADDLVAWLDETLAGLGIESAHLAGTSYGGYLGLLLAARRPARVRSLFLLDPAGVVPIRMRSFLVWGLLTMLASLLPGTRLRSWAARRLRMPALEERRFIRLVLRGQLGHRAKLLPPAPLADEELRGIDVPVHLVSGARSEAFPSPEMQARAADVLPKATVEVVAGAGHAVMLSAQDDLIPELYDFVDGVAAGR